MEQREKILYDTKGKGRPGIKVDTIEDSTFRITKDQTSDSSAVKLKHVKGIIVNQKKKQTVDNGLGSESANTSISTKWAKMTMAATGICCDVSFTTKKLQIKIN